MRKFRFIGTEDEIEQYGDDTIIRIGNVYSIDDVVSGDSKLGNYIGSKWFDEEWEEVFEETGVTKSQQTIDKLLQLYYSLHPDKPIPIEFHPYLHILLGSSNK